MKREQGEKIKFVYCTDLADIRTMYGHFYHFDINVNIAITNLVKGPVIRHVCNNIRKTLLNSMPIES